MLESIIFKATSNIHLILLSMICTIPLYSNYDANIINDIILDVLLWIIILTVCKIVEYIEVVGKMCKVGNNICHCVVLFLFSSYASNCNGYSIFFDAYSGIFI